MNEKYISGFGAGIVVISFGIIVYYLVATGIETRIAEQNSTITFEQLREFNQNTPEKLKNTTAVQHFRTFVGNTVEELKQRVIVENTTLHSELKNKTAINGTN